MEMKDIIDCADKLGYTGEERKQWVKEQEDKARDQRAENRKQQEELRAQEKEKREHDEKVRQEIEKDKEKERQFQLQQQQQELQKKQKELEILQQQTALAASQEKSAIDIEAQQKALREFEAAEKEKDRNLQRETKQMELNSKADIEQHRRDDRKEIPRHNKYQNLIRCYSKDDNLPAWLKNMERCLREENIPDEDWVFILKKSLSGEPQRLIENVAERYIGNYQYLKEKLMHHFKCDSEGYRVRFKDLAPKSNQTFFDYLTEVESVLDSWIDAEAVGKSYERLLQMIIKDKVVSSIPKPMYKFLKEQRITDLGDLEKKGTAYFNANRDVFALNATPEFDVRAAQNWSKQTRSKKTASNWKQFKPKPTTKSDYHGKPKCRHCTKTHSNKAFCDVSPEGKEYLKKHITYAAERRKQCASDNRCFCYKLIGHLARKCLCKGRQHYASAIETFQGSSQHISTREMRLYMHALGLDSESEEAVESSSSDDDDWAKETYGNAVQVLVQNDLQSCNTCKRFHRHGKLSCGHTIPHVDMIANSVQVTEGRLKIYPAFINGEKVYLLRDTGATLVGIKKDLVQEKDYTGEYVICRIFGGTKERYPLAWINLQSAFLSTRLTAAVLPNPCASIILRNVEGIKECSEEEIKEWVRNKELEIQGNVITRNQTRLEEERKDQESLDMILPTVQDQDRKTQFIKSQKEDVSLKPCFEAVKSNQKSTKNASWKFTTTYQN